MTDAPWTGDACSLVDAYRARTHHPLDELEATLGAIDASELNAFGHLDPDAARDAARSADVERPFGGVPWGVKLGTAVAGWPATEGSLALRDRVADVDSIVVEHLRDAGALLVGQTTMSEFAGLNHTRTRLHGITHNPWDLDATPGGSSGGSAAAVAGGLVTIATAGDGGGSTRIPAGFCGLPGLKGTYGRIAKGPRARLGNLTAVTGCVSRSVRDIARFLDVAAGWDPRDPFSLPSHESWEAELGTYDLTGLRVVVSADFGGSAVVRSAVAEMVTEHAELLVAEAGLRRVDAEFDPLESSLEWALGGLAGIREELGDRWPDCADELTPHIRFGLQMAEERFDLRAAGRLDAARTENTARMAALFDQTDLVICATNPDVAFAAPGPIPTEVEGHEAGMGNNGALTIPANLYGNPGISVPIGTVDGRPVGMQIMAPHRRDAWLLDLALAVERERPWPLLAPRTPV